MKASTTLLLLLGSISLSEAVRIEQLHKQSAPNSNELIQTERTDKPKKINIKKDKSQALVQTEKVQKFSAKEELNKKAKVAQLDKMEEALQKASKEVHEQAEQEESAHKSSVASSALSQLKDKQMKEEHHLKAQLAADEKRRMKELRDGEEYARKVDQAELERANQEILAQERATQMKELQEIEAEQRKDADKEEQEFLSAQAIQETKALAAKKAAQKAKISRIKRKHELERHNAEAKLQLFKMQQQEEAETALKDEEVALETSHESKEVEVEGDAGSSQLEAMLQKGKSEENKIELPTGRFAPIVKKPMPEVDIIVKKAEEKEDPMKKENCEKVKKAEELEKKEVTNTQSVLKKVLKDGLRQKKEEITSIQKNLNDEYEKDQADLAKYETNKQKTAVFKDIEVRARTLQEQNKRDKYADELSKKEAEEIENGFKDQGQQAPHKINQAGSKELKDENKYVGSDLKNDINDKINGLLKSKDEAPLPVGQAVPAKPTEPVAAVVKADSTPQAPAPVVAAPAPVVAAPAPVVAAPAPVVAAPQAQAAPVTSASKDMKDNQAKMDKISKADKEKTIKLKDNLKKELKMFSVSLNENHYDNAIKIRQELTDLGQESTFSVSTDEIFKSSFTFPQIANNDFAQDMIGQLQETQNLLAQGPENELNKDKFMKKALYVETQLQERYKRQWVNPRDQKEQGEEHQD